MLPAEGGEGGMSRTYNVLFLCTGNSARSKGDGQKEAFRRAMRDLGNRIWLFLALPLESLDRMTLANRLREIGSVAGPSEAARETA